MTKTVEAGLKYVIKNGKYSGAVYYDTSDGISADAMVINEGNMKDFVTKLLDSLTDDIDKQRQKLVDKKKEQDNKELVDKYNALLEQKTELDAKLDELAAKLGL